MERSESQENILMCLSVAEKRSLFMQIEQESMYGRKKRYTQPITSIEYELAKKANHSNIEKSTSTASVFSPHSNGNHSRRDSSGKGHLAEISDYLQAAAAVKSSRFFTRSSLGNINTKIHFDAKCKTNTTPSSCGDSKIKTNVNESLTTNVKPKPVPKIPVPLPRKNIPVQNSTHNNGNGKPPIVPRRSVQTSQPTATTAPVYRKLELEVELDKDPAPPPLPTSEPPSKLTPTTTSSILDRVKLFNDLPNSKLDTRKTIVSKRFTTQPITNVEHLTCLKQQQFHTTPKLPPAPALLNTNSSRISSKTSCNNVNPGLRREEEQKSIIGESERSDEESPVLKIYRSNSLTNSASSTRRFSATASSLKDLRSSSLEEEEGMPEKIEDVSRKGSDSDSSQESSFVKRHLSKNQEMDLETELKPNSSISIADKIKKLKTNGELNWRNRVEKDLDLEQKNNKDNLQTRLSLLEKSQSGWKKRISENDTKLFTVQGKLEKAGKIEKCLLKEKEIKVEKKKPKLATDTPDGKGSSKEKPQPSSPPSSAAKSSASLETTRREITQNDNYTFTKFFSGTSSSTTNKITIEDSSFSAISPTERLQCVRKNVKLNRKHQSKNPIKNLNSRLKEQEQQSYTEQSQEQIEKRVKIMMMMQGDASSSKAILSIEALAGLASKEDFAAVKLKKAEEKSRHTYPILIQIKGKRFVQSRIVEPVVSSVSSGDCYLLITKNEVYSYIGEFSNRMEKSKLADILQHIKEKREYGINSLTKFIKLEEPLIHPKDLQSFNCLLGNGSKGDDKLGDDYDEEYEIEAINSNKVYELDENQLGIVVEACQPKYNLLKEDSVYLFECQPEFYVWSGSKADSELKRTVYKLAQEKFEKETIVKVNQHMEPILFIEKFMDWPDATKLIRVKDKSFDQGDGTCYNYKPCDVEQMLQSYDEIENPKLELEGFDVCRANLTSSHSLSTIQIKMWNIFEFSKSEMNETTPVNLYSQETYVIRWTYRVQKISRDLKGNLSKHSGVLGRERICYFFYHGKDCKLTEQGASALMTVELDREKGPQIRVEQGKEPASFLSLFNGQLLINSGASTDVKESRLYVALGGMEEEGHLLEVQLDPVSFRSLNSFVLVTKHEVYVWLGSKSSDISGKIAKSLAANIPKSKSFSEIKEGEETTGFLKVIGVSNTKSWRESYFSQLASKLTPTLKIFKFSCLTGGFRSSPVLCPYRFKGYNAILQEELYEQQQPCLYLVCSESAVYLWQGWRPKIEDEFGNLQPGWTDYRFTSERRTALETSHAMSTKLNKIGYLVHAGFEPLEFKTLFPYWVDHAEALEMNGMDGKVNELISAALDKCNKTKYTLEELKAKPEGIDLSKLEIYLSDEEFESLLKMTREDFQKLQQWKQTELKKAVGLF